MTTQPTVNAVIQAPAEKPTKRKNLTFQVYPDVGGKYRWRLIAGNKQVTAVSGESFGSAYNAERAVKAVCKSFGLSSDTHRVEIAVMASAFKTGVIKALKSF